LNKEFKNKLKKRRFGFGSLFIIVLIFFLIIPASFILITRSDTFSNWVKNKIDLWLIQNVEGKVKIGKITIDFFPPLIVAEDVSISGPEGEKFITARRIEIRPDIVSLLQKKTDIQEIAITSPSVNITVENNQITNLPKLKRRKSTSNKNPVVETLSIINGNINFKSKELLPWDFGFNLSSVNLDLTGENNKIFEIRFLSGKGGIRVGRVETSVNKIELRTTINLTGPGITARIKHLDFKASDYYLTMKESIISIIHGKPPIVSASFDIASPLEPFHKLYAKIPEMKGYQSCKGFIRYDDKLSFDTQCQIQNLHIKKYEIGSISSRFIYDSRTLELKNASIAGGGGTIQFNASVAVAGNKEISLNGRMKGIEISKIFEQLGHHCAVEFSGTGPISLQGTLDPVNIEGNTEVRISNFKVFTKHHSNPSATLVLDIKDIAVKSPIEITKKYFRFKNAQVKLKDSFINTDAKINFNKTLDISVHSTKFNAEDVKKISSLGIKGVGGVSCTIRGKMKSPIVKGNGNLAEFSAGGINLGTVNFSLDYSGHQTISFPEINARKGRSTYKVSDSKLIFRNKKQGGILLEGRIFAEKLYLGDIKRIFNIKENLLEKMELNSTGEIFVRYEPQIKKIKVEAETSINQISIFGEYFDKGKLAFDWNTDDINIKEILLEGKTGEIHFRGRKWGKNENIEAEIVVKKLKSEKLKSINFNKFGINFSLSTEAKIEGTLKNPLIENAIVRVEDFKLSGVAQKDGLISVNLNNSLLNITGNLLGGDVSWKSITDINNRGLTDMAVTISNLDLDNRELEAVIGNAIGSKYSIRIDSHIFLKAYLFNGFSVNGKAEIEKLNLKFPEYSFQNNDTMVLNFTDKTLEIEKAKLSGERTTLTLSGGVSKSGPELSLNGIMDMRLLNKFTDEIESVKGTITSRLLLSGGWKNPYFIGDMEINCESMNLKPGALELKNVSGNVSLNRDAVGIYLQGNVSQGKFNATGTLRLKSLKPSYYEIAVEFNDIRTKVFKGIPIGLDGTLTLKHDIKEKELPKLRGEVWIRGLRYTKDFVLSQQVENVLFKKGARNLVVYDQRKALVSFDVTLHDDGDLSVNNNVAKALFRIDESQRLFKLTGTNNLPILTGSIIVKTGTLFWKGRSFEIQRGVIDFLNPVKTEAHFDIIAEGIIKEWKVFLHAAGKTDDFTVSLNSEPELPEEDILLLIQFGMTREQMAKMENAQTVATEVATQALGIDSKIKQLIPIIDQFEVTSEFSPTTNKVEPRITIGKKLTDDIKLSATSGITDSEGMGKGTYFKAVLEYRVTDTLSVQATYDNVKTPESGQSSQQLGNVGMDLKWRIEF